MEQSVEQWIGQQRMGVPLGEFTQRIAGIMDGTRTVYIRIITFGTTVAGPIID